MDTNTKLSNAVKNVKNLMEEQKMYDALRELQEVILQGHLQKNAYVLLMADYYLVRIYQKINFMDLAFRISVGRSMYSSDWKKVNPEFFTLFESVANDHKNLKQFSNTINDRYTEEFRVSFTVKAV